METQKHYYTDEKNAQIVIALLKAHGIKRIVASPGTTNMSIVGSVQNDPWFEVYSAIDERHASYMAVGMAVESGEPVVLSCTGATASRNYMSALTEAYYRKVPVLAITSMEGFDRVGHLFPQTLDRTVIPNDIAYRSFQCRTVKDNNDAVSCARRVNAAILELGRHGGGPVHINLEMGGCSTFNTQQLPNVIKTDGFNVDTIERAPKIPEGAKVAVFVGSGKCDAAILKFAEEHNAAVFVDESSSYREGYRIVPSLLCSQAGFRRNPKYLHLKPDLIVDVGEIVGDYPSLDYFNQDVPVWRVSEDGELRSRFGRLDCIFEMSFKQFANHNAENHDVTHSYYSDWQSADLEIRKGIPDLPFSNPWIASRLTSSIPNGSVLHLGILNSLRSWNEFPADPSVQTYSNVGGFGIDGAVSTVIGASLINSQKLYFAVVGDLAFFYDLNSLGNRSVGNNLRILVVNNGCGAEFNMYFHPGSQFGEHANDYIAAGGHFGKKSKDLVRNFVSDFGFKYLSAESKEEFEAVVSEFVSPVVDRPIVFECFTNICDESAAHHLLHNISPCVHQTNPGVVSSLKAMVPTRVKAAIKELVR